MSAQPDMLVVGAGNEYMGDDGAGIAVVAALEQMACPHLNTFQCGTDLFRLATVDRFYSHMLIVDAVRTGDPPGSIHWFAPCHAHRFRKSGSVHQLSLLEILSLLPLMTALLETTEFSLVGIEPGPLRTERRLSPPVAAAVRQVTRDLRTPHGTAAVIRRCRREREASAAGDS